ncbi:amidase [Gluconacetobacter johannae DSM 13595]|uniref:Cysteine hydrolase n=1 Tax=Gluconacetobacter johannae TaxID=112140 RepID=A0A7W4J697_9PROT|nr:isochorismatase family cysteine hydrolase [Gluconacetobacter johannae]MBB2175253.1 cysteine hydrolase [Gluconacetobacter johannae]GBQ80823.1 amidase [Gluconacetobacter johannae DSM 13595]
MSTAIRYGPLGEHCIHLCVDMQRLFAEKTDWHTPWMDRICLTAARIVAHAPAQTIFTRFIPAAHPGEGQGTWRRYYRHWASMTIERLGADMIELMPELARFVPPADVFDKHVYSPWMDGALHARLRTRGTDTLIITGGETDVCVLATVLGAIDRGYRTIVVTDALCSSSDAAHKASMHVYHTRYGQQIETAPADLVLAAWR